MKTLGFVLRELIGLFVDDGALALEIVAIVALAGMLAVLFPGMPSVAGGFLLLGCLGALSVNVAIAARRRFGGSP
jgi:hypothetical protein